MQNPFNVSNIGSGSASSAGSQQLSGASGMAAGSSWRSPRFSNLMNQLMLRQGGVPQSGFPPLPSFNAGGLGNLIGTGGLLPSGNSAGVQNPLQSGGWIPGKPDVLTPSQPPGPMQVGGDPSKAVPGMNYLMGLPSGGTQGIQANQGFLDPNKYSKGSFANANGSPLPQGTPDSTTDAAMKQFPNWGDVRF